MAKSAYLLKPPPALETMPSVLPTEVRDDELPHNSPSLGETGWGCLPLLCREQSGEDDAGVGPSSISAHVVAVTPTHAVVVTLLLINAVTVFLLVPYLLMFCYSFWTVSPSQSIVHSWTFANYRQLLTVDVYWQTLLRSMWIAARVMLFSLLLGYPLAYYLSFYAGARKDLFYQLVIIPLWVSYLVRAYAWKTILGSDGVLNTLLQYVHLTSHPLQFLLYSPFAVVLTPTQGREAR
jgi:ABC-type glycerol-3-phosphate transport system permease component